MGRLGNKDGAMNEKKTEWIAREREEIAARVANFRATQKKFEKEREEYYAATLSSAWDGFNKQIIWS
jgi:sRNA-binding protein